MIPAPRTLLALTGWTALAALAVAWPALHAPWLGTGLAGLLVAWVDLRAAARRPAPVVRRRVPATLPVGVATGVTLRVENPGARAQRVAVFDHHPPAHEAHGLPQSAVVPASGWAELAYRYRPLARGDWTFEAAELLVDSPLRLWRRRVRAGEPTRVRVYPNFAEVAKYALLATDNRLSQMGIRKRSRRGEGLEFHQLREYHEGDSLRQIDWNATSRLRRLISREYQDERDQQIVLLVDCGRRMSARDGPLSHFDHGLNSVLLLAHVALRQGDLVALMTFGGPARFVAPMRGPGALAVLLNGVYDLEPGSRSPDYLVAASELLRRVRKRSLVVIVTNLRDEDADEIGPALRLLRRRHIVLLASLRERIIGEVLRREGRGFRDALAAAAVHRYLLARRRTHDAIRRSGVLTLDVDPERLPIGMVNRYLDIKRGGML